MENNVVITNMIVLKITSVRMKVSSSKQMNVHQICLHIWYTPKNNFKHPANGGRNSPGCVSETSKKEERTDLGQRVSDRSVKWTPATNCTHHVSLLGRQSLYNEPGATTDDENNKSITGDRHTQNCTINTLQESAETTSTGLQVCVRLCLFGIVLYKRFARRAQVKL